MLCGFVECGYICVGTPFISAVQMETDRQGKEREREKVTKGFIVNECVPTRLKMHAANSFSALSLTKHQAPDTTISFTSTFNHGHI